MDFQLSDEQRAIRRVAREFADGETGRWAGELDREGRFPYEIVAKLGELRFMGMHFDWDYGGEGTDEVQQLVIARYLGC